MLYADGRCFFATDAEHRQGQSVWNLLNADGYPNFNVTKAEHFEIELTVRALIIDCLFVCRGSI